MKKQYTFKKIFWLLLCLSIVTLVLKSCGDGNFWEIFPEKEVKVTNITINPSGEVSVEVGKTTTLIATVTPENATNKDIIWSSLNENIATVDAQTGVVTGVSAGTETIRATAANGSEVVADKSVTVTQYTPHAGESEMVFVQGGIFTMGCTSEQGSDCWNSETPTHQVTLSSYYIGKHQVTQVQWVAVMGSNPSYWKGDNLPVETVSWNDIVGTSGNSEVINGIRYYENGFIYKLNALTGKKYRLPTESEWEYAARGGNQSKGYKYSGSSNINDVAWYYSNSSSRTQNVGTKQANELGIHDMSGNVYEWCSDSYGSYTSTSKTNPTGPATGSYRVVRGGGWYDSAENVRVSGHSINASDGRSRIIGFRLACSSE